MSNFHGIEDLAYEAVQSFLNLLPGMILAIEVKISSREFDGLQISAHALKGAVSNFYAEPSRQIAWKLEQIACQQEEGPLEEILVQLKSELFCLERDLKILLMERSAA